MRALEQIAKSVGTVAPQGAPDAFPARLGRAREEALEGLLSLQRDDGHWCAELEGDTILESEYVLALHFLGRGHEERARRTANYLRARQLPEGGWAIYPGGPPDLSATVKAYFVLKLAGDDAVAPHMERARRRILDQGGLDACNSYTRIYLSVFGQYDWERCPAVPPEMILLPAWFPFSIYEMSSWSRAIVVPLSILWACKPFCPVPANAGLGELAAALPSRRERRREGRGWVLVFRAINGALHAMERLHLLPLRRRAVRRAERWILERLEASDGLAAIFPPILNTVIALRCLGYPPEHPALASQIRELEKLEIEEGDTLRLEPCKSPVWDTALALNSALEAGLPAGDPAVLRASRWLLDHEVRRPGDWRVKNPSGPVGGWYFEYANEFYPDCDDTAEVLVALAKVDPASPEEKRRLREGVERGLAWLLSMQNEDGGWASFDRGCDREFLTFIPFADHNAMIDPSTADITARVLEALGGLGFDRDAPPVRRAVAFLRRTQEEDGSWYGRWGCNYIYGTWLALWGLHAIGEDMTQEPWRRAAEWLRSRQNPDGGWGELPHSYEDPRTKGHGPSTAAQTSWALLGLLAAGDGGSEALRRGVEYLLERQRRDGTWRDEEWTGTGFPKVFYLRYHLYATYFPLLALSVCERRLVREQGDRSKVA